MAHSNDIPPPFHTFRHLLDLLADKGRNRVWLAENSGVSKAYINKLASRKQADAWNGIREEVIHKLEGAFSVGIGVEPARAFAEEAIEHRTTYRHEHPPKNKRLPKRRFDPLDPDELAIIYDTFNFVLHEPVTNFYRDVLGVDKSYPPHYRGKRQKPLPAETQRALLRYVKAQKGEGAHAQVERMFQIAEDHRQQWALTGQELFDEEKPDMRLAIANARARAGKTSFDMAEYICHTHQSISYIERHGYEEPLSRHALNNYVLIYASLEDALARTTFIENLKALGVTEEMLSALSIGNGDTTLSALMHQHCVTVEGAAEQFYVDPLEILLWQKSLLLIPVNLVHHDFVELFSAEGARAIALAHKQAVDEVLEEMPANLHALDDLANSTSSLKNEISMDAKIAGMAVALSKGFFK